MKKYFNVINPPFQLSYCIHSETLQLTIHKIKYLATQWNDEEGTEVQRKIRGHQSQGSERLWFLYG